MGGVRVRSASDQACSTWPSRLDLAWALQILWIQQLWDTELDQEEFEGELEAVLSRHRSHIVPLEFPWAQVVQQSQEGDTILPVVREVVHLKSWGRICDAAPWWSEDRVKTVV